MQAHIESVGLFGRRDPQADGLLEHRHDEIGHGKGVGRRREHSHGLIEHDPHVAAGEDTGGATDRGRGEEAGRERAPGATDAVQAKGIEAVIVAEAILEQHADITHRASAEADDDGTAEVDEATGRGDADEAGDRARGGAEHRDATLVNALDDGPGERGAGGGHVSDEEGMGRGAIGRERAAGVEAKPAKPQQPGAEDGEAEVVGPRVDVLVVAGADRERDREPGDARADVHHGAAGKVERMPFAAEAEPSARTPDPVADGIVDERGPQQRKEHVCLELHALGEGTADDGRGDDRKHELEDDEDIVRDREPRHGRRADAREQDVVEATDEGIAFAK